MKTIGVIHTVKVVIDFFESLVHKHIEDVVVYNILDDYLSKNMISKGLFAEREKLRFISLAREFEIIGADAIVCTCSFVTSILPNARGFLAVPVLSIDEYMFEQATEKGGKFLVAATTVLDPVVEGLRRSAEISSRTVEIHTLHCPEAGKIMSSGGDMDEHDAIVLESIKDAKNYDGIVFAQASMAHLKDKVEDLCGIEVFSAPYYCIRQLQDTLGR